jgi:tetratricopeptide (TPR) repeat protein
MDERQQQIRQGAGLEESRLNLEFIDWLRRWSTPFLLVIALAALGYVVYQRVQQSREQRIDHAFVELEAAISTAAPNPRALEDIARTYRGIRGVPHVARLAAGDQYLRAARIGLAPGAMLQPDGTVDEADLLNEEQRTRYLSEAERLYRDVLADTQADDTKAIHAMSAAYGLAAIAETRGDLDEARRHYERILSMSELAGYPQHTAVARQRMERLPELAERERLYAAAELPPLPGAEQAAEGPESPSFNFDSFFAPQFNEPGGEEETMLFPGGLPSLPSGRPAEPEPEPASPADPG